MQVGREEAQRPLVVLPGREFAHIFRVAEERTRGEKREFGEELHGGGAAARRFVRRVERVAHQRQGGRMNVADGGGGTLAHAGWRPRRTYGSARRGTADAVRMSA